MSDDTNWKTDLLKMVHDNDDDIYAINIAGDLYKRKSLTKAFERLDKEFDSGYGGTEGEPFWAWGKKNIYFCGTYDGSEWITCIPRKPSEGDPGHIGGG